MRTLLLPAFALFSLVLGVQSAPLTDLEITSGDFTAGGTIPKRFTCDGKNDNPSASGSTARLSAP